MILETARAVTSRSNKFKRVDQGPRSVVGGWGGEVTWENGWRSWTGRDRRKQSTSVECDNDSLDLLM